MDEFTLADYVLWSDAPNSLVIVRVDGSGVPDGVAHIVVESPILTIEMVGRRIGSGPGFFGLLLRALEAAGRRAGFLELNLEAINGDLADHYERCGFRRTVELSRAAKRRRLQ
ncbi:MAG TPA: hypothetical protein VGB18_08800 [Candidatus Thermoplasmatota archaeon]